MSLAPLSRPASDKDDGTLIRGLVSVRSNHEMGYWVKVNESYFLPVYILHRYAISIGHPPALTARYRRLPKRSASILEFWHVKCSRKQWLDVLSQISHASSRIVLFCQSACLLKPLARETKP